MSRLIVSLALLLSLAVAGALGAAIAGADPTDLPRLLLHAAEPAWLNAWPSKYCGC